MKVGLPYFVLKFERSPYVSLPLLCLNSPSMCTHCSAHEDCQLVISGHRLLLLGLDINPTEKKEGKSRE